MSIKNIRVDTQLELQRVTSIGQSVLLMLIEAFEQIGIEVVSGNMDCIISNGQENSRKSYDENRRRIQ